MQSTVPASVSSKRKALLRIAPSPRDAWDGILRDWFRETASVAWQNKLSSLVILPTRSYANALKSRHLADGGSHVGLQFLTPAGLRKLLAVEDSGPSPAPEHLRLLLAIAAAEIETEANESDTLPARAVHRAPAHLLRALNRLRAAGWNSDQVQMPSFQRIVRRFDEHLKTCQLELPGETDRRRWRKAHSGPPRFSNILVAGFDGAHWPHWFLLRHAVDLSQEATVLLEEPRGALLESDLCWIGSWEELLGEAQPAVKAAPARGDSLFTEAEMRGKVQSTPRIDFLVGLNASEQAAAITRQCVRNLSDPTCTRLGIVFAAGEALPRLVADALAGLEIPHNDSIAQIVPGIFESAEWQAWIGLQRSPRLTSFLRFLNAFSEPAVLSPNLSRSRFERILRDSYTEVLLDDLDLLREFCASSPKEEFRLAAEALRRFPFLPPRATLAQFLEHTDAALRGLGWQQHAIEIAIHARDWAPRLKAEFSRSLYLRWLEETAATFGASRAPAGDHPYARVQLLTVPHAQNQEWSHLIFAGWNEGAWPPPAGAEFAREEEIREFNRRVQQLNRRAEKQGRQGEGHTSVSEDHALYLGPQEQRGVALRQFDALLDAASEAVTLTAALVKEDAPERVWNPSECFTQLYLKVHRKPLTQATLASMQRTTARSLEEADPLTNNSAPPRPEVEQTSIAFKARRNLSEAASEYDFALRPKDDYRPVPILSVSDLEGMVTRPALVWMKRYLGVEPAEDTSNPWAATSGKWVHHWLSSIGDPPNAKAFSPFPASAAIDDRVRLSADDKHAALHRLCNSLGKVIPDWWSSGWLNARYLARHLGGKIAGVEGWKWMAAEFPIGREGAVKIADEIALQLRGQIDLVLAQSEATEFSGQTIWILDYKTGSTQPLKSSDLHDSLVKGTTLQLGLYSLAVRALGTAEVSVSILSSAVKNVEPQLTVADLEPHQNIFADLAEMQRTGIFGMKGEIRPSFGYSAPYPLATLQVDTDILEDKWALTHKALVLEKEEWEVW